jgi:hypothetical protein
MLIVASAITFRFFFRKKKKERRKKQSFQRFFHATTKLIAAPNQGLIWNKFLYKRPGSLGTTTYFHLESPECFCAIGASSDHTDVLDS